MTLPNDGERMVPALHKGKLMYAEHITRYQSSQELVKDKIVLDIASGSGYGTKILASSAKKVFGVDVSQPAIDYSNRYYAAKNIEYRLGDGEKIPLDDNSVEVVVTYETIEHISDYKKFLDEVERVLTSDGIAIVSTPNDLEFAEGNHFHLHEFTEEELTSLLKKKFKYVDKYYQATWKGVGIGDAALFQTEGVVDATIENFAVINPKQYLYFFFVCSNKPIQQKIGSSIMIGEHYSDRLVTDVNNHLIELNKEVTALKEEVVTMDKDYLKLQSEHKDLIDKYHAVLQSTSWKVTKPLRKIKRSKG